MKGKAGMDRLQQLLGNLQDFHHGFFPFCFGGWGRFPAGQVRNSAENFEFVQAGIFVLDFLEQHQHVFLVVQVNFIVFGYGHKYEDKTVGRTKQAPESNIPVCLLNQY